MDSKDSRKEHYPFPEHMEYIEEMVTEARKKTELIDKELDRTPREFKEPDPYVPRYNPPGFLKPAKQNNPVNVVYNLEKQKADIESGLNKRIEREIDAIGLDEATANQLREATFHKMNPNAFEGKSDKEMDGLRQTPKDMNYSQDYMRQLTTNFRAKENEEKATPAAPEETVRKEEKTFSMSARFTQSLSYAKAQEQKSPEPGKLPDKGNSTPSKE
ncbi:hypothetical protein LZD49_32455 [Dyadobacter sp. CY261]|uniref:hypothetical protein n=1 Tax=Dyadobacter sp. CY261 TaxID=2907203 RepID=UPI001F3D1EE7|nr:hypothetical protein [Dyadobacter sp. CY261]MCF0075240.1 hypothetical protein [Dyadobacter sp. CY261]